MPPVHEALVFAVYVALPNRTAFAAPFPSGINDSPCFMLCRRCFCWFALTCLPFILNESRQSTGVCCTNPTTSSQRLIRYGQIFASMFLSIFSYLIYAKYDSFNANNTTAVNITAILMYVILFDAPKYVLFFPAQRFHLPTHHSPPPLPFGSHLPLRSWFNVLACFPALNYVSKPLNYVYHFATVIYVP
uniref:Uncharacterized protein n=1 Tax=Schistocephalus solidus TaxID=70667 RepID=A0A0X3PW89_SCHSO